MEVCLAVPGRVTKIEGEKAEVDIGGIRREASLELVSDQGVKIGDYVLIHTGYAITKLDEAEAREILKAWRDVARAELEG
ncbi:MAG: [NiFe] hydrogenase metallocenter assembly protein HypC [Candidatus Methanosuratincola subterraneus]|uniref:[NiFe] hydrogenase metallocenter assembly protein HypC n=1 Tax=Methanosuratincola subterraneus TaxID=2593994 RepID=A0A444L6C4_METS7|nr:MAG: [NiFe] hydrogenase metallocenter assembly protein HypC [Candidatus Methanosuratincola subterraneus]